MRDCFFVYLWGFGRQISVQTIRKALKQRVSTSNDNISVQALRETDRTIKVNLPEKYDLVKHGNYRPKINVTHSNTGCDYMTDTKHRVTDAFD